jgi:hypothetical protein
VLGQSSPAEGAFASHLHRVAESTTAYYYLIAGDPRYSFSLANLCGLSDLELRSLLVSINLATISPTTKNLIIIGSAWNNFIFRHILHHENIVEKIERMKVDAYQCYTGLKGKACRHHILHVGRKMDESPDKIQLQRHCLTKIMYDPPTFKGLRDCQRTLRRVTRRAQLDAIVKDTNLWVKAIKEHTSADEAQVVPEATPTKEPPSQSLESPPKK